MLLCTCYYIRPDNEQVQNHENTCTIHVFAGQLEGLFISSPAWDNYLDKPFRDFLI